MRRTFGKRRNILAKCQFETNRAVGQLLARRGHSLRSLGYSEVYLLSQEDALEVFADYPEQRQMLMHHATQLLMERGEVGGAELVEPGPLDPLELCGTENSAELLSIARQHSLRLGRHAGRTL
ncbi:hypothetical protein niasHT_039488 [Heterodera trifolii]|uniref:Uncharacterized protein n=1 Tax=Heterodera trifolii TaxID=157864 RepID=A0ABD2J4Y5_9BILA